MRGRNTPATLDELGAIADVPEQMDVVAIAERALQPPAGLSPDQVIEASLEEAGVTGGFSDPHFRRLWKLVVDCWAHLLAQAAAAALPTHVEDLTREVFWTAYEAGLTQTQIAHEHGLGVDAVNLRSRALGFRFKHNRLMAGPCLACEQPTLRYDLTSYHMCVPCTRAAAGADRRGC